VKKSRKKIIDFKQTFAFMINENSGSSEIRKRISDLKDKFFDLIVLI